MNILEKLLSFFFPPKLSKVEDHIVRFKSNVYDIPEGGTGQVRPKPYRDGIEKYFQSL